MTDPRGNTDPLTFVSIGQDPTKTPGWNVVTLSDGSAFKYAGVGERDEGGIIVQRIALTDNNTGEIGPDGPVLTPAIVDAINAVGGNIPPIHATVTVKPAPLAPIPGAPVTGFVTIGSTDSENVTGITVPKSEYAHESLLHALEAHAVSLGRAAEADAKALIAKLRNVFAAAKAKL